VSQGMEALQQAGDPISFPTPSPMAAVFQPHAVTRLTGVRLNDHEEFCVVCSPICDAVEPR
jgi:hypothetical protein